MARAREGGPTIANRWWVDADKGEDKGAKGARPPIGSLFFTIGYDFDQERAKQRLTDANLKLLAEARPPVNEWRTIHLVPNESVPAEKIERIKRRLPLPPGARGVIVDSGRSARFVLTGDPVGERVLEFTLGEASSFDCWIRGDWVREELFRDLGDALRRGERLVGEYLGPEPHADNQTTSMSA
ncbi:MAG: hypothetical protein IT293_06895 [Deltaproteobacteria bacterium]|nr:hypothetical protein [Deltaproteobacteria bacterium]